MVASRKGYYDLVKYLISKGANVNAKTKFDGWTALKIASLYEHLHIVKYLKSKGAYR